MKKAPRILVVDSSRVVRVTLTKYLKSDFEIIDDASGESAWQALMLDSKISAVISGIHPQKLDAHDILARLRASSIRRLRNMTFILIVSDLDNNVERDADRAKGVTGFITKTMDKSAMLAALDGFFHPGDDETTVSGAKAPSLPESASVVAHPALEPTRESAESGKMEKPLPPGRFNAVLSTLSLAEPVGVLVFRIDNRAVLIEQYGEEIAALMDARFAKLLMSKIGPRNHIGHCFGNRLAIVSHDVDLKRVERFGKQVCRSLASGQITVRGQKVKLTASAGVACSPDDKVSSGMELFTLADQRFDQALARGGNAASVEYKAGDPKHYYTDQQMAKLIEALAKQQDAAIRMNLGSFGLKILPVLRAMNQELSLGLSLNEIEQQLTQRARSECSTEGATKGATKGATTTA